MVEISYRQGVPEGITRADVFKAIEDFDNGIEHGFGPSRIYDVVHNDHRYPPKAIVGLAARRLAGRTLEPHEYTGGESSYCFNLLRELGFEIRTKPGLEVGKNQFWKISPDKNAELWPEWLKHGHISIGWSDFGDVTQLTRHEFEERRDQGILDRSDWSKGRLEQVWSFSHEMKLGDRVLANRGTTEVLGIGTVVGASEYMEGAHHATTRAVEWDDTKLRHVNEGNWRKTLIKLPEQKFVAILSENSTYSKEQRFWIEKTLVEGRADRESGPHALGKALWSPAASSSGSDIYSAMRTIAPGDIVLHLTDNDAFSGVSICAAPFSEDFVCPPNTQWEGLPGYRVPLKNFEPLQPSLGRSEFLDDPAVHPELQTILTNHSHVFFNAMFELNQGAFLTEAPFPLVLLLDRLYRSSNPAGLRHVSCSPQRNAVLGVSAAGFGLMEGIHQNPNQAFYNNHREEFKLLVEQPFRALFAEVIGRLQPEILRSLETRKRLFSKILKNDYGRGGAYDYYWGAIYPKGGKRVRDAQLYVTLNHDSIEYGFALSDGVGPRHANFQRNKAALQELLRKKIPESTAKKYLFVSSENDEREVPWEEWVKVDSARARVSVLVPKETYLNDPTKVLGDIVTSFNELFPFMILAISKDPEQEILQYLGEAEDAVEEESPPYSLTQCAKDTGFDPELLASWARAIERKKQAVLYGPPGTGKTFIAHHLARHLIGGTDGMKELVQFHPAYAYEDFIQGLRPIRSDDGLDYVVTKGRFLDFCEEAAKRRGPCVLIIDEINRANLARVFGELMYLLEYRKEEVPLSVDGFPFSIPDNVRLIGTMNTADRSIALVDHALRRRFSFIRLDPNLQLLRHFHERHNTGFEIEPLLAIIREINEHIANPDYEIGVSFFMHSELEMHLDGIWTMEIEPYLEEYFFDRISLVDKFRWDRVANRLLP